jgi:hypothetical protein
MVFDVGRLTFDGGEVRCDCPTSTGRRQSSARVVENKTTTMSAKNISCRICTFANDCGNTHCGMCGAAILKNSAAAAPVVQHQNAMCPLCHTAYDDDTRLPRVLGCAHTFCTPCLATMVVGSAIVCPEDDYETPGPFESLPRNRFILNRSKSHGSSLPVASTAPQVISSAATTTDILPPSLPSASRSLSQSYWNCPTCTFANSDLLQECEMCGTACPVAAPTPALAPAPASQPPAVLIPVPVHFKTPSQQR